MPTLKNAQCTNLKGTIDWLGIPIRAYSKSAGGPRAANENPRVVRHAAEHVKREATRQGCTAAAKQRV